MSGDVSIRRGNDTADAPESVPTGKTNQRTQETETELPYTDNSREFLAKEFDLGEYWNEDGIYDPEINALDNYIRERIESGEIANSATAVRNELKELDKINNLKKEERASVKMGVLAAYARFMGEKSTIKKNIRKYGY